MQCIPARTCMGEAHTKRAQNEQVNQFLPPLEDIDNGGKQDQETKLERVKKPETDADSISTVSLG